MTVLTGQTVEWATRHYRPLPLLLAEGSPKEPPFPLPGPCGDLNAAGWADEAGKKQPGCLSGRLGWVTMESYAEDWWGLGMRELIS